MSMDSSRCSKKTRSSLCLQSLPGIRDEKRFAACSLPSYSSLASRIGGVYLRRLSPTRANGQPAFAVYRTDEATGSYRGFALQVLTLDQSRFPMQVAGVTAFLSPELVTAF